MSVVYTSVVVGILLTLIRLAINVIETITGKKLIKEEEAC
jgi:TRAP-type C4-dicarboxylate transport system permease small subunit